VDNEKTAVARGAGAWGTINPTYRRYAGLMKFHVDACAPRQPQRKGKVERRVRDQRAAIDPYGRTFRDLAELQAWTDARVAARAAERRCPATATTVAEAWAEERRLLTPVPETAPEPFDLVAARRVGRDGLVAFEGRQYSVPSASSARLSRSAARLARCRFSRTARSSPAIRAEPSGGSSSTSGTTTGRAPSG